MSDSMRPHRQQSTRLPCPWDSPGKNTGVGCHFLLQCMKVKSESEVAQSCLTLSNPMDCSLPDSSIRGIFQARVLEWGAIAFSSVILEPIKIQSATVSTVFPPICHEVMGLDAMILVFWMLSFKPTFSLSTFTFIKRLFSFLHFLP